MGLGIVLLAAITKFYRDRSIGMYSSMNSDGQMTSEHCSEHDRKLKSTFYVSAAVTTKKVT